MILWRRGLHRQFPVFFSYLIFGAIEEFTLYGMDVLPAVSVRTWWLAFCTGLIVEGFLRLGVMGELFFHLLRRRPAIAKVGGRLITFAGAVLVLVAALVAAYAPVDDPQFAIASRAHVLQQTLYLIESGLILFLFVFSASFGLAWDKASLGIGLGRGISSSVHLATWAVMANGSFAQRYYLLDFLNMAAYHICVLIWFFYFLVPQKKRAITSAVTLPENNLDIWNRELERLIHQ